MIRTPKPKRTWMKVSKFGDWNTFWVAVEYDSIVEWRNPGTHTVDPPWRADDTLSTWARSGWKVEGPFDAPE